MGWQLTTEPTARLLERLEPDTSVVDDEENFRADYKRDRETGKRYRKVHLMPNTDGRDGYQSFDPPLWQAWLGTSTAGRIYFRCPKFPDAKPVDTRLTMTKQIWEVVGPGGQSVACPSCGETHVLSKDMCELIFPD